MSFTRSMYKVGIDIGGTNTKFLLFDKKIKNYSNATIEVVKTPLNLIKGNKVYIDVEGIDKMINSKLNTIGFENISNISISGQMHSSLILKNEKIIDGPYSWQSEKHSELNVLDSRGKKKINDIKRGYPVYSISNYEGRYCTLLTYIFAEMTGNYNFIHYSEAASSGMFDFESGTWNSEIIKSSFQKVEFPKILKNIKYFKHKNFPTKVSIPVGDFQMSMFSNIVKNTSISINIATGGQIALIGNEESAVYQLRPTLKGAGVYDCYTQLPAGRLIDLFKKLKYADINNLMSSNFDNDVYEKTQECKDLFTRQEMETYINELSKNSKEDNLNLIFLSSILKKYINILNKYHDEYKFNEIILSGSILENYYFFKQGLSHFFKDCNIKFNKQDVLKTHYYLLKNT